MHIPSRAAVIGGSAFGRFHAQWYAVEGAEVVAFTATTSESVAAAEGPIRELTGQEPRGYTDIGRMLEAERPDVVSVCTPPGHHDGPTLAALAAGAHVLCEKPLVYDGALSSADLLAKADALLGAARDAGRVLAVNLQYAAVLDAFIELYERRWGELADLNSYELEMESRGNRHGLHRFEGNWIELGPHALAPLLRRLPNAQIDEGALQTRMSEADVEVETEFVSPDGHRVHARFRTGCCPKEATPVRRMAMNGFTADILTRRDSAGRFRAVLRAADGDEEIETDDLMQVSIRRFLLAARGAGTPLASGDAARRNLAALLLVRDHLAH